jgi:7-alpha-hydroxysteroid dehydrogenase
VICDPDDAALSVVLNELREAGASVAAVGKDVMCDFDARQVVDTTISDYGRIDMLVNGLAETVADSWLDLPAVELGQNIGDGVGRALACTRAAVPHMIAAGGGRIVNVISSVGRYRSAYFQPDDSGGSSVLDAGIDGAILALTRQLAFELAPKRIRVNAVTVGWIRTTASERAWRELSDRDRAFLLEEISLRRLGEPDEAAAVVEFLVTEASSYVTGAAIDVNGGWWMS